MNASSSKPAPPGEGAPRPRWSVWLIAGCGLLVVLVVLATRRPGTPPARTESETGPSAGTSRDNSAPVVEAMRDRNSASRLLHSRAGGDSSRPPEVVVADKLTAFTRDRREIAHGLADRFHVQVPPEVDSFFDAVESGKWADIKTQFNTLSAQKEGNGAARSDLEVLWPAVKETYGVATIARSWPPKEILDYGESVLAALRPGMVYIAGSDAARYIPALLAENGGGDRPLILPQNSLSELNQIGYLSYLHGDQLVPLERKDAEAAFADFVKQSQSAAAAAGHPATDSLRVSGPMGMAGVNERLIQKLMEKNPGMSFAIEQSIPMEGLMAQASPLGPLLELHAGSSDAGAGAQAGDALNFWQQTVQRLQADSSLPPDSPSRTAYAQMASAQAAYFADHEQPAQAEQAYRLGMQMAPASIDAVQQLSLFLSRTGKQTEAMEVVEEFGRNNPDLRASVDVLRKSLQPAPDLLQ